MNPRLHAPGCRYEGSAQPCDSSACKDVVLQEVRVLLTDAYVLLAAEKPGFDVHVDGSLAAVWRDKYEKLIAHVKQCGS
jgi:hypothetical protein